MKEKCIVVNFASSWTVGQVIETAENGSLIIQEEIGNIPLAAVILARRGASLCLYDEGVISPYHHRYPSSVVRRGHKFSLVRPLLHQQSPVLTAALIVQKELCPVDIFEQFESPSVGGLHLNAICSTVGNDDRVRLTSRLISLHEDDVRIFLEIATEFAPQLFRWAVKDGCIQEEPASTGTRRRDDVIEGVMKLVWRIQNRFELQGSEPLNGYLLLPIVLDVLQWGLIALHGKTSELYWGCSQVHADEFFPYRVDMMDALYQRWHQRCTDLPAMLRVTIIPYEPVHPVFGLIPPQFQTQYDWRNDSNSLLKPGQVVLNSAFYAIHQNGGNQNNSRIPVET